MTNYITPEEESIFVNDKEECDRFVNFPKFKSDEWYSAIFDFIKTGGLYPDTFTFTADVLSCMDAYKSLGKNHYDNINQLIEKIIVDYDDIKKNLALAIIQEYICHGHYKNHSSYSFMFVVLHNATTATLAYRINL